MRTKIIAGTIISIFAATILYATGYQWDNSNYRAKFGMGPQNMQSQQTQAYHRGSENMNKQYRQGYHMSDQHMQGNHMSSKNNMSPWSMQSQDGCYYK